MTELIEYRNVVDKSDWGPGPWQDEPDKKQWQDEATGYPCLIVRNTWVTGALCGYVAVSKDHPLHGKGYSEERVFPCTECSDGWHSSCRPEHHIEVHGGLGFADSCHHGGDPSVGVCHIPGEGEPDEVWWFGFDCSHAFDHSPMLEATFRELCPVSRALSGREAYRDFAYVEGQVAEMARQLKAMEYCNYQEVKLLPSPERVREG